MDEHVTDVQESGIKEMVKATLAELGVEYDSQKSNTLAQLFRLEEAIACEIRLRKEADSHNLSVLSLSKLSGISRQTFYNKQILVDYIDRRKRNSGICAQEETETKLKSELEEAKSVIEKLMSRDGEIVLLKIENDRLKKRISSLEKYIEDMQDNRAGALPEGVTVIARRN